jgi:NAD(P)-dependent dehydrogenase (short-subunit alcohol dehydrogenase family)
MSTIVVTGAASGIGLEAARALLERGDRVIVCARSEARCAEARAALGERVETVVMDMASIASIRDGAARVREIAPVLDVLINNAGVLQTKKVIDGDGHEMTWAVNVIAPYLLSELLVPSLEAAEKPRVVNVGSVAHRAGKLNWDDPEFQARKFTGWSAYSQSKLALMLVTREFARLHPKIAANCVHPGGIATGIYRNVPTLLRSLLLRVLPGPAAGAVPLVYLATEPGLDGVTGRYFNGVKEAAAAPAGLVDADATRLYELLAKAAPLGAPSF